MRTLTKKNVEDIATGAAVLGTGGGGDPHVGKLMAQQAIERNGPVELLDPHEVPEDALVVPAAIMGAPTAMLEKIPRGDETVEAFQALERYMENDRRTRTLSRRVPIQKPSRSSTSKRFHFPIYQGTHSGSKYRPLATSNSGEGEIRQVQVPEVKP